MGSGCHEGTRSSANDGHVDKYNSRLAWHSMSKMPHLAAEIFLFLCDFTVDPGSSDIHDREIRKWKELKPLSSMTETACRGAGRKILSSCAACGEDHHLSLFRLE